MLLDDLRDKGPVTDLSRLSETEPGGTALHKELEDCGVAELVGDHVGRLGDAEAVDVDAAPDLGSRLGK